MKSLLGLLLLSVLILASTIPSTQLPVARAVSFLDATAAACKTSSTKWRNSAFRSQAGTFTVSFDATPDKARMNGVTALSTKRAADWSDTAASVRFFTSGYIEALNGSHPDGTGKYVK